MRLVPVALLGSVLALVFPGLTLAENPRAAALRTLADYWATQASNPGGWLQAGVAPGYVPVAPPDSSLWSPGSLLVLSETAGFEQIAPRESLFPARRVRVLGTDRADTAVLGSLTFGRGGDRFHLKGLPGILEAFGVVRSHSATLAEDLQADLDRFGVRRVTISLPDAQVHRLATFDLETYLSEGLSESARRLLARPDMRIVTSAIFLKTVQLRFETDKSVPELAGVLEKHFGTDLTLRSDGSLKFDTRGVYVAIQTGRYWTEPGRSLTESTRETRNLLLGLLAGL